MFNPIILNDWFPSDYAIREQADEKIIIDASHYLYSLIDDNSSLLINETFDRLDKFERGT